MPTSSTASFEHSQISSRSRSQSFATSSTITDSRSLQSLIRGLNSGEPIINNMASTHITRQCHSHASSREWNPSDINHQVIVQVDSDSQNRQASQRLFIELQRQRGENPKKTDKIIKELNE